MALDQGPAYPGLLPKACAAGNHISKLMDKGGLHCPATCGRALDDRVFLQLFSADNVPRAREDAGRGWSRSCEESWDSLQAMT
jgi:hypothetical protein